MAWLVAKTSQKGNTMKKQERFEYLTNKVWDETQDVTEEELDEQVDLYYELSGDARVVLKNVEIVAVSDVKTEIWK